VSSVAPGESWTIGDYVVDPTPVESGAFGTVYKARRRDDGRRVALKLVLSTDAPDSDDKLAAERRGAELQQQFARVHGLVPEVYDFGSHGRHFYIAMEFVEGGSLAHAIATGALPPEVAARHAVSICEFLEKAHRFLTIEGEPGAAIVHADLKPQHILLPTPGEIRVLDFGIAKALARTRQVTTNIWGTIYYASPEQLESGHVSPHVDFWSLGVMLYEMIAGHRPHARLEANRGRLERAIRTNEPREPLPASCPPPLAAIVNKLLAYQPDRRYPDAAAIRADLEAFLSGGVPVAATEFDLPETTRIERPALPPQAQSPSDLVPPTDPLPVAPTPPTLPTLPLAAGSPVPAPRERRRMAVRRLAWLALLLSIVGLLAFEGVAWVAAERFRGGVGAIDGRTLADRKRDYDRIGGWGPIDLGLHWRVDGPLTSRLVSMADAVIADYRREEPAVGPVEWRQAAQALRWAQDLAPDDRGLRAKLLSCEAHETRLAAQALPRGNARRKQLFRSAITGFKHAASVDPQSFDPYLGMSRTQVYGLDDVEAAAAAIAEAEKRGYSPNRREHAQLGDGYLRQGEKSRRVAANLTGEQRARELENARVAYGRCVELFDPILDFGNAAHNLEFCKRQLATVSRDLDAGTTEIP
jgi:serine/threonine-protein kinase